MEEETATVPAKPLSRPGYAAIWEANDREAEPEILYVGFDRVNTLMEGLRRQLYAMPGCHEVVEVEPGGMVTGFTIVDPKRAHFLGGIQGHLCLRTVAVEVEQ